MCLARGILKTLTITWTVFWSSWDPFNETCFSLLIEADVGSVFENYPELFFFLVSRNLKRKNGVEMKESVVNMVPLNLVMRGKVWTTLNSDASSICFRRRTREFSTVVHGETQFCAGDEIRLVFPCSRCHKSKIKSAISISPGCPKQVRTRVDRVHEGRSSWRM